MIRRIVFLPLAVLFFLILSGRLLPVSACDDTLLALITSSDPKSEFSRGIRQFNREVSSLGSALKENRLAEVEGLLGKVMESWLGLSNRFSLNPPEEARGDANWSKKMEGAAERIGAIRKLIREGNHLGAHNLVLDLSNHLGSFFESVKMSESYRVFLKMSEHFFSLQKFAAAGNVPGIQSDLASLTTFLKDLEPFIATDTMEAFQTSRMSLAALSRYLNGRTGSETQILVKSAEDDFLALRSRILMMEWFPMAQPQSGSGPASPAGVPTTGEPSSAGSAPAAPPVPVASLADPHPADPEPMIATPPDPRVASPTAPEGGTP